MTQEMQLRSPDPVPELADPMFGNGSQEPPPANPLLIIHRLLRGRYHWCILLGLLGLGVGGFAGYKVTKPTYSSTGLIDIKPYITPLVTPTPETGMMPAHASFVEAQVSLIKSQRVMDAAMQSEEWRKLNRPYTEDSLAEFTKSLKALVPSRGGQIVLVSFEDEEPAAAAAAVKSVMQAYNRIYVEGEIQADEARRKALENRRLTLANELRFKRESIQQAAADFGTDELRPIQEAKLHERSQLQTSLNDIKTALDALEARQPGGADGADGGAATQPAELTQEEIAVHDAVMRQLLREIAELRLTIDVRLASYGENHPEKQRTRAILEARIKEAQAHAEMVRKLPSAAPARPGAADLLAANADQLRARQKRLEKDYVEASADLARINKVMAEIDRMRAETIELSQRLEETRRRLDQLSIEAPMQERIQIRSFGDRPVVAKDKRIQLAGAGGFGGAFVGVGLVALLGLMDRRMHSPDDAKVGAGRLALLGVLPVLPDDLSDPEQAAVASHCVHQIRTLLQIRISGHGNRVFAITSPSSGTGKTSLTLGLGVSFASSGAKTLMIDCDVMGGGLTQRVDAIVRRKIGRILQGQGLLTNQQLESALRLARNSQRRLGEVLVELGYLEADDVRRALVLQEQMPLGLLEALGGENVDDCIAETGIQGLHILPLGNAVPSDMSRVSPDAMRRLLQQVMERFDTILIDTGPVPGSVEASALASVVDAMIMVVSRGESRPLAERSIAYLRSIGAPIAGLVFNRAQTDDMDLSTTTDRLSSRSRREAAASAAAAPDNCMNDSILGPLASAVRNRNANGANGAHGGNGTNGKGGNGS